MNLRKLIIMWVLVAVFGALPLKQAQAKELVMGLIPAENNEEMIQTFEPMRAYLEKKLGEKVKVFTATDYAGVVEAMRKKRLDLAWFGPLSYVLAEQEAGAEAFAVGVLKSTGKSTYRSMFVVPADSTAKSIKDLKGKSAAFVDPASTSGGLMPSYMVKKETGLMPKEFFGKFTYAGSHDSVEMAVKNKTVDAGADNDITYTKMLEKGLVTEKTNRVLQYSDPLPGSPLCYRGDLPADLKAKIKDVILNAHSDIKVTGYGDLSHYESASPKDYELVRNLIKELGLQKQDMLK